MLTPVFCSYCPLAGVDSTFLASSQGLENWVGIGITSLTLARMTWQLINPSEEALKGAVEVPGMWVSCSWEIFPGALGGALSSGFLAPSTLRFCKDNLGLARYSLVPTDLEFSH